MARLIPEDREQLGRQLETLKQRTLANSGMGGPRHSLKNAFCKKRPAS